MKINSNSIAVVLLLFLYTGLTPLLAQSEKSTLWKVTGKNLKAPSYLFGTYHLLTDKFVNEIPEVKSAFSKSKGVVVEMVIDSSKLQMMMMQMIMPGKKISEMIPEEEFGIISAELERTMGVTLKTLDQMKPAAVMTMLTLMYTQEQNAEILKKYAGIAMDIHFASLGKQEQKTITPLETMEEQMAMLYNNFPLEEQARQLVAFARYKDLVIQSQAELLNIYLTKDLSQLHAYAESLPKDMGDSNFLLKDRNEKWVVVLPDLMKKEAQFIAVGALHLPGPHGVIELLRKQGYTVKPVNIK